ncbi:hypothetical protein J2Y91_003791 [Erwinia aphidicola]|nr:hypothetical protein [Erwinia aphidicola]
MDFNSVGLKVRDIVIYSRWCGAVVQLALSS